MTHADNSVSSLSQAQLKGIYSGELTNWRDVGGLDLEIVPYQRYTDSRSQCRMEGFMGSVKMVEPKLEIRFRDTMPIFFSNPSRYRNWHKAIGYSFLYHAPVPQYDAIKFIGIDGVFPTPSTIRDGSYPLAEKVCIITAGDEKQPAKDFIEWVLSPQGQYMLEEIGFISVSDLSSAEERPMVYRVSVGTDSVFDKVPFECCRTRQGF